MSVQTRHPSAASLCEQVGVYSLGVWGLGSEVLGFGFRVLGVWVLRTGGVLSCDVTLRVKGLGVRG